MTNVLEMLVSNGLSNEVLLTVLKDLIVNDDFQDDTFRRCCVALAWHRERWENSTTVNCQAVTDDTICIVPTDMRTVSNYYYRVLTADEANEACRSRTAESLWAFDPQFLSETTGLHQSVFDALSGQLENANDAIMHLVKASCGFDEFLESAISRDGRGGMFATYDGVEHEYCIDPFSQWYLYRIQ